MRVGVGHAQTDGEDLQQAGKQRTSGQCSIVLVHVRSTQIARHRKTIQAVLHVAVGATRARVPRDAHWLRSRERLPRHCQAGSSRSHVRITALRVTFAFPSLFSFLHIVIAVSTMVAWKISSLLLLSLRALGSFAAEVRFRIPALRDIS